MNSCSGNLTGLSFMIGYFWGVYSTICISPVTPPILQYTSRTLPNISVSVYIRWYVAYSGVMYVTPVVVIILLVFKITALRFLVISFRSNSLDLMQ